MLLEIHGIKSSPLFFAQAAKVLQYGIAVGAGINNIVDTSRRSDCINTSLKVSAIHSLRNVRSRTCYSFSIEQVVSDLSVCFRQLAIYLFCQGASVALSVNVVHHPAFF